MVCRTCGVRLRTFILAISGVLLTVLGIYLIASSPSNNRDWASDQKLLSTVSFEGDLVHISNVRNISYITDVGVDGDNYYNKSIPRYYNRTDDLSTLKSADIIIDHFSSIYGIAHTFLTFNFDDGTHIVISVEARREKGEFFSPVLGVLHQYELVYVIADEQDEIKLRAFTRNDSVYMYPLNLSRSQTRELYVSMLKRSQHLQDTPEFYNTLDNNCMTNILEPLNTISPRAIPVGIDTILPGYSDGVFYNNNMIDTKLSLKSIKKASYITDISAQCNVSNDFSSCIRRLNSP